MAALQFWHSGGEVYATGAVPVSDDDFVALATLFTQCLATAIAAGAADQALSWAQATEALMAAFAERARWRAATRPRLAA